MASVCFWPDVFNALVKWSSGSKKRFALWRITDKIFYDQTSSDFEESQSWSWKQGEKSSKMKIKLCIFLAFVAICIAQQEREKKRKYNTVKDTYYILYLRYSVSICIVWFLSVFSIFSVVSFKNDPCQSTSSISSGSTDYRNGTCRTSE